MDELAKNGGEALMSPALQMGAFGLCALLVGLIGVMVRMHRDMAAALRQSFEQNIERILKDHRELYDRLMDHHSRQEEAWYRAQSQTIEHNTQVCGEVAGLLRMVERRLEQAQNASDRQG